MPFLKLFRWLGFFKAIPLTIALLSGSFGIAQQIILLYSKDPDPVWQEKVFWSIAWIAFVISAIGAWIIEHNNVRSLEQKLQTLYSKLDIEITEVFAVKELDDNFKFHISMTLLVTNHRIENTAFRNFQLLLRDRTLLFSQSPMVRAPNNMVLQTSYSRERRVFPQGIPQEWAVSFEIRKDDGDLRMADYIETFSNEAYTLIVSDSYGRDFTKRGVLPDPFTKTMEVVDL